MTSVIDDDEPEFIVGQDLLKALGIDVDRQLEQLVHRDDKDDDDLADSSGDPPVSGSPSTDGEIQEAVEKLVKDAVDHGFPSSAVQRLRSIAFKHDIGRLALGNDPPARVKPLKIRLKDGVKQAAPLSACRPNVPTRWASPVLPVRKPSVSVEEYRQTSDYRLVNDLIEALISTMPHMSTMLEYTKGKKHCGLFDLLKGFWQLPLDEFSQELMSYITDEKIYTPRRVPQGCCDAAVHFQQTMEKCFESLLYESLVIWIDDLLLFADDIDTYLTKLEHFFDLVDSFGLKLSAKKSSLYQQTVRWCGRIIDSSGVSHDPERIDVLRSMPYPTTAGQLQQFLCAANWMRESIVDYARAVDPLQQRLDDVLSGSRRTKRVAAGIVVELTDTEKATFDRVKDLLATSATLALPDDTATICVFSDASETGYALILTQVKDFDAKIPITSQQHKLVTCLSGTFRGSQLNWTVIEKEAYPIVVACDKLNYVLLRARPFRLFCDHRNLIHVFAPHTSIKRHIRGKLLRWALKLMAYRYVIEHVDGASNVWADMISRWAGHGKAEAFFSQEDQTKQISASTYNEADPPTT